MKKKSVWISVTIVVAVALTLYYSLRGQGYIKIATAGAEMQLGWFGKTRISSAGPVTVSTGVYRPRRLSITAKRDGNSWRIKSFGPWAKLARIRVKKEQTTILRLGPPFSVKTDVRRRGRMVLIALSVTGQAGEYYSAKVIKNGRQLPVPQLKIVDQGGKVLASGKFKYG